MTELWIKMPHIRDGESAAEFVKRADEIEALRLKCQRRQASNEDVERMLALMADEAIK